MRIKLHQALTGHLRLAAAALAVAGLALAGCNGTVSRIGVPAASPWNTFGTTFLSPHDDLTVVTAGSDISAGIVNNIATPIASCNSDQGAFLVQCGSAASCAADCVSNAPSGATGIGLGEIRFLYGLVIELARPAFSAGGVQIESAAAGTVGAISVNMSASSGLSVGAGFSDGLIPGPSIDPNVEVFDNFGVLAMEPDWPDFGEGWVCADGTSTSCDPNDGPENLVAFCLNDTFTSNGLFFRVNASPGAYSLTCGTVPVNLDINPPFSSVGQCISTLKAQRCGGLRGRAKAACNHAQIGVCHATFNVPKLAQPRLITVFLSPPASAACPAGWPWRCAKPARGQLFGSELRSGTTQWICYAHPMVTASIDLARLARELQKPEAEIMTMAFEAGLRQLWRERTLGQYLRGEVAREQAIERAGIDWVELAEQQQAAMYEDLAWARRD